jgi:hypothetical protein
LETLRLSDDRSGPGDFGFRRFPEIAREGRVGGLKTAHRVLR